MTEQELRAYIEAIRPADEAAMDAARAVWVSWRICPSGWQA